MSNQADRGRGKPDRKQEPDGDNITMPEYMETAGGVPHSGVAGDLDKVSSDQAKVMGDPGTHGGTLSGGALGGTTSTSAPGSRGTAIGATMGGIQSGAPVTETGGEVNPSSASSTSTGSGTGPGRNTEFRNTTTPGSIGGSPQNQPAGNLDIRDGLPGGTTTGISARGSGSTMSDDLTAAGIGPSTGDHRGNSDMPMGDEVASLDTLAAGRIGSTNGTPGTGDGGTFKGAGTNIGLGGTNREIGEPYGQAMSTAAESVVENEGLGGGSTNTAGS